MSEAYERMTTPRIDAHTHIFPPDIAKHRNHYLGADLWFRRLYLNRRHKLANGQDLLKSMDDAGINDGDTVIVKKTNTANNGQIVVALIDDHEAMLKRLRKKGKVVALESANKRYETKIFGPDRVKVQGVLVSLYRNFQ